MKQPKVAVRDGRASLYDVVFAGGSTAVFLVILAGMAEAVAHYLR